MILIILTVGLIIFIAGFLIGHSERQRLMVGSIGLILLVFAAVLMIGNDTWHWGMHVQTKTTTTKLTSSVKNDYVNLLLYEPVKQSNTEKVYVYRAKAATKRQHTAISIKTTNRVHTTTSRQAKLTTTTKRWAYNNQTWRWLYADTGSHTTLISTHNTFTVPKTWATLSVSQAKWLEKQAKTVQKTATATVTKAVTAKVKAAKTADPSLTSAQVAKLTKQVQAAATKQATQQEPAMIKKLIAEAKQQSIH
ncbi:DUF4811 domain-containing protein [Lactiplantibacillus daowaiensis]|uniref:DUF4811 domain-containing protein n=1 Tax=Lactiplantibacillus daowaiensis TaxID=2559918 RepID=A0ABW1RX35_9LACO|nr:DUF4811 domain-containing protein [Lactiplantibacillus daowaiensis]